MRTMIIALRRGCLVPFVVIAAVLALATSASAVFTPGGPRSGTGAATELIIRGTGAGQAVTGFIARADNPFDPLSGYPATNPTTGFDVLNEGFAGIITASPPSGGPTLLMYCIDIRTLTQGGFGYTLGDWDAANVPLVGYIGRILNDYYPTTTAPASFTDVNQKAAAVQAAIWFFSDKYVLSTSSPLHDTVAGIVAQVIAAGPLQSPPPPSLTITPESASAPAGSLVGPFTVTSSTAGNATVRASGATMFTDAGGTLPVADGASVASGAQIWLRSEGAGAATLSATATATVPTGNVYLYSGNVQGVTDAQKLILAQTGTLTTTASANADFQPPGSLTVTKSITGAAAATHGQIVIHVVCDGTALTPDFVIAAGATAPASTTYQSVPAGSKCLVTETADGGTATTSVVVVGSGAEVIVPPGAGVTTALSNTYTFLPGSLVVRKTISGPAAGSQAAVTIHVECPGIALDDFVIPAGSKADTYERTYTNIPADTVCTVTETANGSNAAVSVVTVGGGAVTVPAGGPATAELTNDYTYNPGSLTVTKTINGPGVSFHGAITIEVTCDGTLLTPVFTIPAGAPGTSQTYNGIPGNATCFVVETVDGHQPAVTAEPLGSGQSVTVPPGGTATATITDTFQVGSLVVNKTITGRAAGAQGPIAIHVDCGVGFVYDINIPAGTAAGTLTRTFPDVPAGASCVVTEPATGATNTITVVTVGSPQTVTIGAGGTGQANLTDAYDYAPGSLTVTKTIAGSAAGQQGEITIEVVCGNTTLTPAFVIPAGTLASSVSQTYAGIPGNSTCSVQETVDGATTTVDVVTVGSGEDVTVGPGSTAEATITDTYTPAPGALKVQKTISGPAAGRQGEVTIDVDCGDDVPRSFVIAAGTPAGTTSQTFDAIPAGSNCAVTETADGTTSTVQVAVEGGDQTVVVGAASTQVAEISNLYTDVPGKLVVTKTIAGSAAGRQSAIEVLVDCGTPAQTYSFTIPAGAPADTVTGLIDEVEAGSTCTVTETADGSSSTISVVTVGGGQQATIGAAGVSQTDLTDTFTEVVVPTTAAPTTVAPTTGAPTTVAPTTGAPTTLSGTLPATGGGTNVLWPGALLLGAGGTILLITRRRPATRPRD